MAKPCSVCSHPDRETIDKFLVSGVPYREITRQFRLSRAAVGRHKLEHLPETLRAAQALLEAESAVNVSLELRGLIARARLLLNACDAWLRDAEDPDRYDIGPRSGEILVTYTEPGENGKPVRKKSRLSTLLHQAGNDQPALDFVFAESKTADPRELLLKACAVFGEQLAMFIKIDEVADLQDRIFELERRLTNAHRIS